VADQVYNYYVSFVGSFMGETKFGSQKISTAAPLDDISMIDDVANHLKAQKHFSELTILFWRDIKG